jgi:hypothetical protein
VAESPILAIGFGHLQWLIRGGQIMGEKVDNYKFYEKTEEVSSFKRNHISIKKKKKDPKKVK